MFLLSKHLSCVLFNYGIALIAVLRMGCSGANTKKSKAVHAVIQVAAGMESGRNLYIFKIQNQQDLLMYWTWSEKGELYSDMTR